MRDMQAARGTPLTGPAAAGGSPGAAGASTQGSSGAAQPAANRPRSQQRRRIGILLAVAVAVLALDIISKALVVAHLASRQIHLLGGFLTLRESRNPGAAFSLGTSLTVMYSAIAVAVIVVILRTSRRIRSLPWAITLGLLLGGATGNLMDRSSAVPASSAAGWWTGSRCRTGPSSTWPTRRSSAAASSRCCCQLAASGWTADATSDEPAWFSPCACP